MKKSWNSGLLFRKSKTRIPVEAASLLFAFMSSASLASTGSWSSQPSWATPADERPTHRSVKNYEASSINDVTPFAPGSNNLALDLGQVFLMGDLGKYENSLGTQLHYTYGVSDLFGFDTSLGYSQHSDGLFSMTTVLTGMRLNMSWYDKVIPYGIFGLGFYRPSYQDQTVSASSATGGPPSVSAILFGLHFGAGVDLALTRNLFFGSALTFHNMFGTDKTFGNGAPLSVGGSYASFFLHIGATF